MSRYIPFLAGALVIVGLTYVQVMMTDRLAGSNFTTEQRAELLSLVPKNFGDWTGEDKPVDPNVRKTAGAVGAVSRDYRNTRTGEKVELWLIVGHARDVSFHTPDVCYPGSGFEARAKENGLYPLVMPGRPDTPFWTNTFYKEDMISGRTLRRVFWAWYNPNAEVNQGSDVVWEAPQNARWYFGNTRGLYKMYFTSEMADPTETAEQSACLHFARDFLPEVDKALLQVNQEMRDETAGKPSGRTSTQAPVASSPSADQPADQPAEMPAIVPNTEATPPTDGVAPATASVEQPNATPDAKTVLPGEVWHALGAGESAPPPAATPTEK